jgi:hypothetical protein
MLDSCRMRPPALRPQVRHDRAGELDRTGQVGGDHAVDVRVGELFRRPHHPVAGVRRDDVDEAELGERGVDDLAQPPGVRDVELTDPEPLAVPDREIVQALRPAEGRGDAVSAFEQPLGKLAAEAA